MALFSAHIVGLKNINLGSNFKDYSDNRTSELLKKYATKTISYKTTLEKKIQIQGYFKG